MALGWIYVLSNDDMPGLLKIGQSATDPELRASELYTTGVPSAFTIEYKGLFDGYALLERRVHAALIDFRRVKSREFFQLEVAAAITKIREVASTPAKFEECSIAVASARPGGGHPGTFQYGFHPTPSDAPFRDAYAAEVTEDAAIALGSAHKVIYLDHDFHRPPVCPRCGQRVSVSPLRLLKITCPACREDWIQPT